MYAKVSKVREGYKGILLFWGGGRKSVCMFCWQLSLLRLLSHGVLLIAALLAKGVGTVILMLEERRKEARVEGGKQKEGRRQEI